MFLFLIKKTVNLIIKNNYSDIAPCNLFTVALKYISFNPYTVELIFVSILFIAEMKLIVLLNHSNNLQT